MSNVRRAPVTVSLDADTRRQLQLYAHHRHTSVSQAITDWVWSTAGPAQAVSRLPWSPADAATAEGADHP